MTPRVQLLWLAFGPIGDSLMMTAVIHELVECNPKISIRIGARRNERMIREMLSEYSQVEVTRLRSIGDSITFLRNTHNAYLLIPPTFGVHGIHVKGLALTARHLFRVRTLGFSDKGFIQPYTIKHIFNIDSPYIDNIALLLRTAGFALPERIIPNPNLPELPVMSLGAQMPFIFVQLFAGNPSRTFSESRWRDVLTKIRHRYPIHELVVSLSKENKTSAEVIVRDLPNTHLYIDLSIPELVYALKHAKVFIGPDTGVTHIASVLGKNSVVIGNQSNPTWLPTYNPKAHILYASAQCTCDGKKGGECVVEDSGKKYLACMYNIKDTDILAALDRYM